MLFLKKRADISLEEFGRHWLDVHSKVVLEFAKGQKGIIKYEQVRGYIGPGSNNTDSYSRIEAACQSGGKSTTEEDGSSCTRL